MNRLQHESSPYLLQHADNPVDWYPWGEEALERARKEDKPIIVSIGYSTCHWCHVMERESFRNKEVAHYMNALFINIKVDREERPDIDQLYMEACEVITGSGGWPLNLFLLPDGRPFFGGTYFPPDSGFNRQSWFDALQLAAYNFYENRAVAEREAEKIMKRLDQSEKKMVPGTATSSASQEAFPVKMFEGIRQKFDLEKGGFGTGKKFPNTMALEFLMHYAWYKKDEQAKQHLHFSLKKMLAGGIYDHLGGGLARYAVDRDWLVPHFEKMLYDNALLVALLSPAYRWTEDLHYKQAIEETLDFVEREMTSKEGGFYAALDAESEGAEGKYYTWSRKEIEEILQEDAEWFCHHYGITEEGNWEGKNILFEANPPGKQSAKAIALKQKLFQVRQKRKAPHRDEKSILSWNALQNIAYSKAYAALGHKKYLDAAIKNMGFLKSKFLHEDERSLKHVYTPSSNTDEARIDAYLNDYAFFIQALLELYYVDFNLEHLELAAKLCDHVIEQFYDPDNKLFFFSPKSQKDVIRRRKELFDEDMPSGNTVMLLNLQQLTILFDRRDFHQIASGMLKTMQKRLENDPFPIAGWANAALIEIFGLTEFAVSGPEAFGKAKEINGKFFGPSIIMASDKAQDTYPLLAHRWQEAETLIYLCKDHACMRPVKETANLEI